VIRRYLWRRFSERVLGADAARPVELPPAGLAVTVAPMTPDTLDEILALGPTKIDREVATFRFRRGDHGVVAKAGGRVVSSVWIGSSTWRLRDLGLEIRLAPDQVVLYDAYTAPEARRMGVMALLVRACVEQAAANGQRWLFARAVTTNANTMSTLGRAGFREVLTIRGAVLANAVAFYRIARHGAGDLSPDLLPHLIPLRPGFLLWSVGGRRGFKLLVPRFRRGPTVEHGDGVRRYEGTTSA
jgi:GNAT superfamily N-acetyltransferase